MPEYETRRECATMCAYTSMKARIQKVPKFLLSQHSANAKFLTVILTRGLGHADLRAYARADRSPDYGQAMY